MKAKEFINEAEAVKQRLDPKCWPGKKIGNPKTKVKGGVRVNNCVPIEEEETGNVDDADSWQSQQADTRRTAETNKMSQQDATAGGLAENFADGRNPQDKGDSKRHGVPTKASVSTLRKVAKQGGRKGQLAHWMANMKAGRAKNEDITEDNDCPPATQDISLNLKNRQKAIDEYGYGPLNPDLPNNKFWMKKVDEWNLDSMQEAQSSLCGNCAAFDIRQNTLDCIAQGIDSDSPQDAQGVIDAGDLGYCKFLKFKCASRRTCDAWVTGGPLTDEQGVAEDIATATEDQVWTKGPNTYLLHRTNSSHRLINQNGKSVAEFKVPLRYIEAHLEDQGFRLSKTSAMSRRDPNWFNSTVGMAEAAHTTNFNDDDWYEIDPGTKTVVSQRGPQAYQMPSGQRQIKLPNGNIVVRGMRAKYMDLDTGLGKSTR